MESTNEDEPRFYSQAAAAAMHTELEQLRADNRRLQTLVGALNREADNQAETITNLRADVELWRARYARDVAGTSDPLTIDETPAAAEDD